MSCTCPLPKTSPCRTYGIICRCGKSIHDWQGDDITIKKCNKCHRITHGHSCNMCGAYKCLRCKSETLYGRTARTCRYKSE